MTPTMASTKPAISESLQPRVTGPVNDARRPQGSKGSVTGHRRLKFCAHKPLENTEMAAREVQKCH